MNHVQFTNHAVERLFNRFDRLVQYGQVQTVLVNKPLSNGQQKVIIATLPSVVRIFDEQARNGKYIEGKNIKAVVNVTNRNEVNVITIVLE